MYWLTCVVPHDDMRHGRLLTLWVGPHQRTHPLWPSSRWPPPGSPDPGQHNSLPAAHFISCITAKRLRQSANCSHRPSSSLMSPGASQLHDLITLSLDHVLHLLAVHICQLLDRILQVLLRILQPPGPGRQAVTCKYVSDWLRDVRVQEGAIIPYIDAVLLCAARCTWATAAGLLKIQGRKCSPQQQHATISKLPQAVLTLLSYTRSCMRFVSAR